MYEPDITVNIQFCDFVGGASCILADRYASWNLYSRVRCQMLFICLLCQDGICVWGFMASNGKWRTKQCVEI